MRARSLFVLAISGLVWTSSAASQNAVAIQSVNVRAGPDPMFPLVTWLSPGQRVSVFGCIQGWRWCDVFTGRHRGWVYSRFLAFTGGGRSVVISTGGPTLGLPMVTFSVGSYWGAHYQGTPWFSTQAHWNSQWGRHPPPPVWHAPPPSRPPSPPRPPTGGGGVPDFRPPPGNPPPTTTPPRPRRTTPGGH
jgi:uncharacterized protein YraI